MTNTSNFDATGIMLVPISLMQSLRKPFLKTGTKIDSPLDDGTFLKHENWSFPYTYHVQSSVPPEVLHKYSNAIQEA